MRKFKTIFKDAAGNKIKTRFVKKTGRYEIRGYNAKGKLVDDASLKTLVKKGRLNVKLNKKGGKK